MQLAVYATLFLSFVASSLAYLVNAPNGDQGVNWKSHTPGRVAWNRVDTDPRTFTIVLTNQDRSVLPHDIVLAGSVDGTRGSLNIQPPRGGFPVGEHFRINFVKVPNDQHTIYAQSNEFSINH
ncbi:hypothetical protein D9756_002092 [Leucocoprinus leucothites]|uniref:Yeast cell wall synthesis Kre9/Knh1-like N-terminal domain-containing protein n=1 Tax=Leucocoprinus leucothites TaxID=201217 RepID=A0A8H5GBU7_9AGAR|nr:hypothetical protein D9756_002092 [Leucoagaricus leucothites]